MKDPICSTKEPGGLREATEQGMSPVVCPENDGCHKPGTCDPATEAATEAEAEAATEAHPDTATEAYAHAEAEALGSSLPPMLRSRNPTAHASTYP